MLFRSWMQKELAWVIGIQQGHVSNILTGKRGIGPGLALKLEAALDIPALRLLELQVADDLAQAPREIQPELIRRRRQQLAEDIRRRAGQSGRQPMRSDMPDMDQEAQAA